MPKRTRANKKNVEKIIMAWNEANEQKSEKITIHPPEYKGLTLSFNVGGWRIDHPDDFPEFCRLYNEMNPKIYDLYSNGNHALPFRIIEMLLTGEIIYEELETFITMLVKMWDESEQARTRKQSD